MHIAEYFPGLVAKGDAVYVLDGTTDVSPAPPLPADVGPPPEDAPTTPDTVAEETTTTLAPEIILPETTTTIVFDEDDDDDDSEPSVEELRREYGRGGAGKEAG
jgi:hypothetical protein